jgi:sugar O-acyltransferase (sialic acid O-acetyltransferase NeuD family)
MLDKVIIYGNGSIARLVYSYSKKYFNIVGFCVDDALVNKNNPLSLPIIPFSKIHSVFNNKDYKILIAVGFVEMNEVKQKKYNQFLDLGYNFASFIHPNFYLHDGVTIEENCVILDNVSIHSGSKIKKGTFISSNVNIGHDCVIEDNNWINSGVSIAGECTIGQNCFFGVNSSVANGITVGKKNFIGANTLINKDTSDDQVYISKPGELFKMSSKNFIKYSKILE